MELSFSSLLLFGLISLVLYLIIILLSSSNKNSSSLKLPPGKLGWPFIGETLDFVSSGQKDGYKNFIMDRMKKYSPHIFKTSIIGEKTAVLCGPEGNKFLFSNENKLVVSWWPSTINKIFSSNGTGDNLLASEAKILRDLLPEVLKPDLLYGYVPIIHSMTKQHLESEWVSNKTVKVYPLSKKLTFSLACRLFVGVEDSETVEKLMGYYAYVTAGMVSLPVDFPGTKLNRSIKAANAIRKELLPIINKRRRRSQHVDFAKSDLLSRLLKKTTNNDDDDDDDDDGSSRFTSDLYVADKILGLFVASHDTTSSLFTSVVYH